MSELRLLLATLLFCLGIYLLFDLFIAGFDVLILLAALACFIAAHYIKPNTKDEADVATWWEWLDIFIDIPFRLIAALIRGLSRPFRGEKGDIDFIDL